ncbi:MAG TPA: thioredoxin [Candidatus Nanoarchaeia archaeon]|nr:thioredoxin [Candidatus Nanoarchaeia archaeon]
MVEQLTDATFVKEIQNKTPIIVDFWASWCGPCLRLAPIFEKLAESYKGKLRFAKLNVEENETAPQEYGVSNIPCLIVFASGKEVDRIVGVLPEAGLKDAIDRVLAQVH